MVSSFINYTLEAKILSGQKFNDILIEKHEQTKVISFINPFSYSVISKRPKLIDEIEYWFVDGMALCQLTNLRRNKKISRASFDLSSIGKDFLNFSSANACNVALIGGSEDDIKLATQNLKNMFPKLNIVFQHHGYIKNDFESVYAKINSSGANYLVVGMGTPMQEEFSVGCKKFCPKLSLIITCGGFITQTAMKPDYYHPWIKKLGLRWLQRAYLHKHVRQRLIKDYPSFIIRYLINR